MPSLCMASSWSGYALAGRGGRPTPRLRLQPPCPADAWLQLLPPWLSNAQLRLQSSRPFDARFRLLLTRPSNAQFRLLPTLPDNACLPCRNGLLLPR